MSRNFLCDCFMDSKAAISWRTTRVDSSSPFMPAMRATVGEDGEAPGRMVAWICVPFEARPTSAALGCHHR